MSKEPEELYLPKDVIDEVTPKAIVMDVDKLHQPRKEQKMTAEQINTVSAELYLTLVKNDGYGLSTPQIDSPWRACIVDVKEPLVLINPKIVKYGTTEEGEDNGGRIVYIESCLSLPKTIDKPKKTKRFSHVVVQTDNLGVLEFGPDSATWKNNIFEDEGLLESVCVQHEIDHLNGRIITDEEVKYNQQVTVNKIGRNEKVMIKSPDTDEMTYLKYKHAQPLIENEGYTLV